MAEQVLGTATLNLAANTGRLQAELAKANQTIQGFASKAKSALGALAIGAGAGAFVAYVKGAIDAADAIDDLAERTGISTESLATIEGAARRGGVSLQEFEGVFSRLPRRLAEFADASSEVGKALRELDVDPTEGLRDMPAFLEKLGTALSDFTTDASKAAVLNEVLGKGGDALGPAIEKLGEARERAQRLGLALSGEAAGAAGEFNDRLDDMADLSRKTAMQFAEGLLPSLTTLIGGMAEFTRESTLAKTVGDALGGVLRWSAAGSILMATAVGDLVNKLMALYDTGKAIVTLDFSRLFEIRPQMMDKSAQDWKRGLDTARELINGPSNAANAFEANFPAQDKPRRSLEGMARRLGAKKEGAAGGGGKSPEQQRMENEAAAARQLQEEIARLASERVTVLDRYRALDLVSETEYYETRRAIQSEAMQSALSAVTQEVTARQAVMKRTKAGTAEYENAVKSVQEAEGRRADVQRTYSQAVQEDWFAQARAAREYQDTVRGITAELAELEGQAADAAAIRFDEQHGDTVRQALDRGDAGTIERVGRLRRNRISDADFGAASEQASSLQQRLQIDEERIQNNLRMGAIGDIEAMRRTSTLRQEALEQLTAIEQRMRDVAAASSDPRIHLNLAQFQADLERLRAEADVFGLKMREIGEGSVAGFFDDIVSGAKSVKDAFKDMVGSILSEMSRIVSRDIARAVMGSVSGAVTGGTGGGSGWAGLLGSIGQAAIGYFQGGGAGAGVSTGGSYAYASPEALAIPARDRRALGGVVIAGREYVVGDRADRAPEWFVPQVSGRIVTADPKRPDAIMLPGPQTAARTLATSEAAQTPAERMRRALGGLVVAGSPYIVGDRADRGREWFTPAAEQVRPAVQRAETMSQLVAMRDELQSIRVTASETIAPRMQRALGGAVIAGRPYVVGDRADRRAEWFEPAADRVRAANRRALGGMVVGGQTYSVNEQVRHDTRPEVFIPAMNGSVANKAPGGRPGLVVNMTVNTRDAKSFLESESQVQASVARAANRGRRNL